MAIALSSVSAFAIAVAGARSVNFCAYTLHAGVARDALVSAARAGAHVRVRLEREPLDDAWGSLHRANREAVVLLRAAGADADLTTPDAPVLHMKAAVVDDVAWLDDRNWTGETHETVLRDTERADVGALRATLEGADGDVENDGLRTTKRGAQYLEVDLLRAAGAAPVAVESESFGSGGVYNALLARANAKFPTRLLVAGREAAQPGLAGESERRRLAKLQSLGVDVRTGDPHGAGDLGEKLAVAGAAAWVGSANATYARGPAGDQRDWGLTTREPSLVDGLRAAFERNWSAGHQLEGATP